MMKKILLLSALLACFCAYAQGPQNPLRRTDEAFFATDEARRIGDQVLLWQRETGGWPKNIDMASPMTEEQKAAVLADKSRRDDSTTDNDATNMQMWYLARLYRQTGDAKYRDGFLKGLDYLLEGQYPNGGWPQFWPVFHVEYAREITFNDGAMVNTLNLFKGIFEGVEPFGGDLVPASRKKELRKSFDKGVECILNTQIIKDGKPSVWCQQYNEVTLEPAYARAFELPSYCSAESVDIVKFLMSLEKPSARVKKAVHGAMEWFDSYKLTGFRYTTVAGDRTVRKMPGAPPLWARFYDLQKCEPFFCDRDGIPRRSVDRISHERRNGYGWYTDSPMQLYALYGEWADKYDPAGKIETHPDAPGANENGTFDMDAPIVKDRALFDAVVEPGQSIQAAINKAPVHPEEPYKILILKGFYEEKVILDKPGLVLVGEDRDSTVIRWAETSQTQQLKTWNGKSVGSGTVVLLEGADDCIISGLTIYNDYGVRIAHNTDHQFAVFGRGTRTIIINCKIWSAGSDTIALWADYGMYYHADLDVRSLGVDFICPRGWCFATRCSFTGAGHAILWHDGHQDPDMKFVLKGCSFDAVLPTTLGRYHHDSQFYLINCRLSKMIKDEDIHHAYVLAEDGSRAWLYDEAHDVDVAKVDRTKWGRRVYCHRTFREGGDSGWLEDDLHNGTMDSVPSSTSVDWAFGGRWNPETAILGLWDILEY